MRALHRFCLALSALAFAACAPEGAAPAGADAAADAPFDQTGAEAEITAWARAQFNAERPALIEPISTFFGDFSGDGAPDAIAFAYIDTGGSSPGLDVSLFRNEGGHMTHLRQVEVYGMAPREVRFSPGEITLTTTMPQPGDALCCPTGSREWTVPAE